MEAYRVERTKAPVTLTIRGGTAMAGCLFLDPRPADEPTVAKVHRLFNDPSPFLPLELAEGRTVVVNKDRIVACRYDGPIGPVVEILIPRRRVTLILEGGMMLTGDLVADGPPDQRRVLDCLNRAELYFLVEARDGDYVVRRDAVECVPSEEQGEPREEEAFALEEAPQTTGVA